MRPSHCRLPRGELHSPAAMEDTLADRMKQFESVEAGRRLETGSLALARMDGRAFSTYTRDLARPFDPRLSRLMIDLARLLVAEAGACAGYTQSDEITLVMAPAGEGSQIYFDGRLQKMVSQLAAYATAAFHHLLPEHLPEKAALRTATSLPTFDARVWSVPDRTVAVDVLRWRQQDGVRNSVSMTARAHFSAKALHQKDVHTMRAMLRERGAAWEEMPDYFKRGTLVRRRTASRRFSADELQRLPPMHAARREPELTVERTELVETSLDLRWVSNLEAVVFDGAEPYEAGPPTS